MEYKVGDIVTLKKGHPCGSHDWKILRVGADFRLECQGCGHQIMIARKIVEKNTKDLKACRDTENCVTGTKKGAQNPEMHRKEC